MDADGAAATVEKLGGLGDASAKAVDAEPLPAAESNGKAGSAEGEQQEAEVTEDAAGGEQPSTNGDTEDQAEGQVEEEPAAKQEEEPSSSAPQQEAEDAGPAPAPEPASPTEVAEAEEAEAVPAKEAEAKEEAKEEEPKSPPRKESVALKEGMSPLKPPQGQEPKAEEAAAANAASTDFDAATVTPSGTVQALTQRLSSTSGTSPNITPPKLSSVDKLPTGPLSPGSASAPPRPAKSPSLRSAEPSPPPSSHDTKNTINVSQLIKLGAFKMVPLKDFVPYEELLRLRLEDGIDATRKEDYLDGEEFKKVFKISREEFNNLPAWRRVQAKKTANLF
ncbi:hypothetical protein HYH03_003126 [Edaphochlamys debaryana]|uniref:HP domain-containing protein n=1 Tax=Edaphochlamys debaryana TaxID=47281 RepID=A0A835YDN0_9CHLO|nr:hypothetical protein HYH03_003126 [Edaphochlamys debaryana]|eukprot:KAG2498936.1 hypothetical protein HYH03_003126 [Edaphochlamys debaryana]